MNGLENKLDVDKVDADKVDADKEDAEKLDVVQEIPTELHIQHPLQNQWALWFLKGDKHKPWEECLKKVSVFNTVEDFWCLFNHIQPASGLGYGDDYYLFKDGIRPMWEDEKNINGGRWLVLVDKNKRQKLDQFWLELMMAVIGEQFDQCSDMICGAAVNVTLWTRDALQQDKNRHIGGVIKNILNIPDAESLIYEMHKDSKGRNSSSIKAKIKL